MKNMKKLASIILAMVMVFSLTVTAFAADNGTITIKNAAKGETYKAYKLFGAELAEQGDGIVYTGTIPTSLTKYFKLDSNNHVVAQDGYTDVEMKEDMRSALTAWTKETGVTAAATKVGEGAALEFSGLSYGYYVITTSQGAQLISVTSTKPEAVIVDKNTTEIDVAKKVNDDNVAIGDTVTYTATFTTVNYVGAGEKAEKVYEYKITDTLPEFLKDVTVTKITIGGVEYKVDGKTPQFENKTIIIPWVDKDGNSKYDNGAKIVVTYTAVVTDKAVIDGNGNTNKVSIQPFGKPGDNDTPNPLDKEKSDEETIYTYATGLQKVDQDKKPLAGAKFSVKGLTVNGSNGNYIVVSYDRSENAAAGTEMETDDEGVLIIRGLPSDETVSVTETEAPAGYNKLDTAIELQPVATNKEVKVTTVKTYYDADGNVIEEATETSTTVTTVETSVELTLVKVVNNKGTILPETGGMGTTIFYVLGSVMVLGAAILLVTKKRMGDIA